MYAIEIMHKVTGEEDVIMGYNFEDACRRRKLNPDDWYMLGATYED